MTQTNTAERKTLSVRPATSRKLLARKAAEQATAGQTGDDGEALEALFPAGAAPVAHEAAAAPAEAMPVDVYIEPTGDDATTSLMPAAPPVVDQGDDVAARVADKTEPASVVDPAAAGVAVMPAQAEHASGPDSAPSSAVTPAPAQQAAPTPSWSAEDESALNAMLARRKAAGYQRRGRDVSGQVIRLGDVKPNPDTVVAVIVGLVAAAGGSIGRAELIERMAGATFPNAKAQPGDKGWCGGYVAGACRAGTLVVANAGDDRANVQSGNDAQVAA